MSVSANATQPNFDQSRWPIVVVTPPTQAFADAAFPAQHCDTLFALPQ
jgi:hypothetical protein